jgi:FKBP-type peptidyl-prolyl cis-trans isomerase FkpA
MIKTRLSVILMLVTGVAACGGETGTTASPGAESAPAEAAESPTAGTAGWTEITPGLRMRILVEGSGEVAMAGQVATVHYTGWLHDPDAADGRGKKFDSSVDRGQYFEFPLGAGRVIQGWDQGVVGMKIGETRELLIAPEMAYGDRNVGNLIPPGSTLLFEVELAGLDGNVPGEE